MSPVNPVGSATGRAGYAPGAAPDRGPEPAGRVRRAVEGVRWYLREIGGESRWEAYLERCRRDGTPAMTRREYERHRSDVREHHPQGRCC